MLLIVIVRNVLRLLSVLVLQVLLCIWLHVASLRHSRHGKSFSYAAPLCKDVQYVIYTNMFSYMAFSPTKV